VGDIGLGIIGLGIGMSRGRMASATPGVRVAAACSLSETERDEAASEFGVEAVDDYRRLLDRPDVDVVGIFTPAGLRREIALDAIAAGKHVLLTKPMEVNIQRCDDIITAADQQHVQVMMEFDTRYRRENRAIKQAIDAGLFGRMLMADVRLKWRRDQDYYESGGGWRGTWALDGGGSLANQAIHFVDRLQWFMGGVESVFSYAGVFDHDIEAEDQTVSVVRYANGGIGTITSATTAPSDLYAFTRSELHGTRGGVVTMTTSGEYFHKPTNTPYVQTWLVTDDSGQAIETEPIEPADGPTNVMEDLVATLRDGAAPMADGREGRKSIEILNAVYLSAHSGREVKLPLDGPFIPRKGSRS